jgi:diacylglycerol kinase family enzyme
MIVFINPFSGQKQAESIFKSSVDPFIQSNFPSHALSIHITQSKNNAFEITQNLVINEIDPILYIFILGGDGLIHEIINGLALNRNLLKAQLFIIPCGSGNALANSLGYSSVQESLDFIQKRIQTNTFEKLHISNVSILSNDQVLKSFYSFCVISYGFHAQLIRQSEYLRPFLGSIRFLLTALYLSFWKPKSYKCLFKTNQDYRIREFTYFLSTRMNYLEKGFKIAPKASYNQSQMDLIYLEGNSSSMQMITFLDYAAKDGKHCELDYVFEEKTVDWSLKFFDHGGRLNEKGDTVHDVCVDGELYELLADQSMHVTAADFNIYI